MDKAIREALIPLDLAKVLERKIFDFYKEGLPVDDAIRVCAKLVNRYWEERDAYKSGS